MVLAWSCTSSQGLHALETARLTHAIARGGRMRLARPLRALLRSAARASAQGPSPSFVAEFRPVGGRSATPSLRARCVMVSGKRQQSACCLARQAASLPPRCHLKQTWLPRPRPRPQHAVLRLQGRRRRCSLLNGARCERLRCIRHPGERATCLAPVRSRISLHSAPDPAAPHQRSACLLLGPPALRSTSQ